MLFAALLKTGIYLIASALLYPVLVLLTAAILYLMFYAGLFFAEWLERVRLPKTAAESLPDRIRTERSRVPLPHRVKDYLDALDRLGTSGAATETVIENLFQDRTLKIWKSLDILRLLVRAAPGLGLMGTLIPMGTGLAALGQGDITRLSSDLVIAFTTTVVGLAAGLTAFFFYTVKRRWVEEDVKNIELATDILTARFSERHTDAVS